MKQSTNGAQVVFAFLAGIGTAVGVAAGVKAISAKTKQHQSSESSIWHRCEKAAKRLEERMLERNSA